MNILLLGGRGLLGSEFSKILEKSRIPFQAPTRDILEVTNSQSVDCFFQNHSFDLIIYCIAYTRVDRAEEDQEECHRVNVKGLQNILKQNIPIIHFSSDYVFNAPVGIEIPETYNRFPLNFYAHTKIEAEHLLEQSNIQYWNIRTSWLFGPEKENFITKILKKSEYSEVLEVVHDQIGRPTYTKDLAQYVVQNFVLQSQPLGHYHVQNTGNPSSWADIALFVLDQKGISKNIEYISTDQLDLPAQRPLNSVLKNTKLSSSMRDWKEAVVDFLETLE